MSDKPTRTFCESCDHEADGTSEYCPSCGTEDPWVTEPKYDFEDVDFPVIVEYEVYNDTYGLWREFCAEVFGIYEIQDSQIANVPDSLPRMKSTFFNTYWKITETDIEGPFLSKEEARDA